MFYRDRCDWYLPTETKNCFNALKENVEWEGTKGLNPKILFSEKDNTNWEPFCPLLFFGKKNSSNSECLHKHWDPGPGQKPVEPQSHTKLPSEFWQLSCWPHSVSASAHSSTSPQEPSWVFWNPEKHSQLKEPAVLEQVPPSLHVKPSHSSTSVHVSPAEKGVTMRSMFKIIIKWHFGHIMVFHNTCC